MGIWTIVLGTLTALEFCYIFYLETFATTSNATSRVFKIDKEKLSEKNLNILFKNQGCYNGLIALWLLYGIYLSKNAFEVTLLALVYIVCVATFGAITSDKMIFIKQGGLAILSLFCLILNI